MEGILLFDVFILNEDLLDILLVVLGLLKTAFEQTYISLKTFRKSRDSDQLADPCSQINLGSLHEEALVPSLPTDCPEKG